MAKIWMPASISSDDLDLKQITSDATALPEEILEDKTAYVSGERIRGTLARRESGLSNIGLDWRTPTLTPGQSISLGSGSNLYVGIPKGAYLDSDPKLSCPAVTIPYEQRAVTPTKLSQVIISASGKVLKQVTVNPIPGNYITTDDANAQPDHMMNGNTAYVKGVKITGTMANQGTKTASLNCGDSYTISAGYHNGSGKITANSLSSQTAANATANYLAKDKTAWVNGTKITGTVPDKRGTSQPCQYARINNGRFEIAVEAGIYGCNWNNNAQDYEYLTYQKVRDAIGLTSGKLKYNEGVLGLTGTFTGDANLEAGSLLSGYSGYSKGTKINGSMPNRTVVNSTIGGINSSYPGVSIYDGNAIQFNPTTGDKVRRFAISPPTGYYLQGASYVGAPAQTKTITPSTSIQTVKADSGKVLEQVSVNAIPNNRGQYQYGTNIGESGDYYAINGLPEGYYVKNGADWAPEARISKSKLREYFGITADKIRRGTSIAGVSGEVDRYIQYTGYGLKSSTTKKSFTDMNGNTVTHYSLTIPINNVHFVPMTIAVFNNTWPLNVVTQDQWHIIEIYENSAWWFNYGGGNGIGWGNGNTNVIVPVSISGADYCYVIGGYNNS
ncbi:MAG: hypothetical protein HFG78_00495 [Hungatella sp.]|nr:hypothetical protein [Hungatella sp.]